MLKSVFTFLMLGISLISYAQIQLPALSPAVEISQKIGLTEATLTYSRPSLRGRDLFGEEGVLVLGEKWRTGANAVTKVEFSKDVLIQGQSLAKGAYALLTTPETETWTFHFYPYEKLSYTKFLDKEAIVEITVPHQKSKESAETMSLHFDALNLGAAKLVLRWGTSKAELSIELKEHDSILSKIDKVLSGPSAFNYFQAALYLHETQTDLPLALTYIQKATKGESALFFQVYREALILKDLNKKEEAVVAARRSMELSEKAGNADFVRLNEQLIESLTQ